MRHRSEHFCEASISAVWILWGSIMEGAVFAFCSSPALSTTVPQAYLSEAVALSRERLRAKNL